MHNLNVLILCAGDGKRLRPLTNSVPKPLLPLYGKPIVEHIVDRLLHQLVVQQIVLNVQKKHMKKFDEWRLGKRHAMMGLMPEEKPLGFVASVRNAISDYGIDTDLLVINGDTYSEISYNTLDEPFGIVVAMRQFLGGTYTRFSLMDKTPIIDTMGGFFYGGTMLIRKEMFHVVRKAEGLLDLLNLAGENVGAVIDRTLWQDCGILEDYERISRVLDKRGKTMVQCGR